MATPRDAEAEQVYGAILRDNITGEEWTVRAKAIINATGPFSDSIRLMDDPQAEKMISGSSGIHITLPEYYSPRKYGLLDPRTSDGRVIFFLPWQGSTIAGTTDRACSPQEEGITPTEEEISFILREIAKYLSPSVKVRREDVLSSWAGIRPLVRDPARMNDTQALARNHVVLTSPSGLITLAGGKWTTYRSMAQDTVDAAVHSCQLSPLRDCCTRRLQLVGAHEYSPLLGIELVQQYDLTTETGEHLAHTYGDQATDVLQLAADNTSSRWPKRGVLLDPWYPYIEAEVRYAARYEMARTASDILFRRTRLANLNVHAAKSALPRVIQILAEELGWDQARQDHEYQTTLAKLKRQTLTVQQQSTLDPVDVSRTGGGV